MSGCSHPAVELCSRFRSPITQVSRGARQGISISTLTVTAAWASLLDKHILFFPLWQMILLISCGELKRNLTRVSKCSNSHKHTQQNLITKQRLLIKEAMLGWRQMISKIKEIVLSITSGKNTIGKFCQCE